MCVHVVLPAGHVQQGRDGWLIFIQADDCVLFICEQLQQSAILTRHCPRLGTSNMAAREHIMLAESPQTLNMNTVSTEQLIHDTCCVSVRLTQ